MDIFRETWDRFSKELYNYIYSRINNKQDAEDLLQNISIKIYNNIDKVKDEKKLKPWIYTITKNTLIDYYKKKKIYISDIEEVDKKVDAYMSDNMNEDIIKCLGKMIYELPEKYQEVIELHDLNGMKHKDISEKLDISISCSKMRTQRGKEKLKEILLECCDIKTDTFGNIVEYQQKKSNCTRCSSDCD